MARKISLQNIPQNIIRFIPQSSYFMLDYEGTLVPEIFDQNKPGAKLLRLLDEIPKLPGCRLAIFSKMKLGTLMNLFPYASFDLVGGYGLQIKPIMQPPFFAVDFRRYRPIVGEMLSSVRDIFPNREGYTIEDLGVGLSIQFDKSNLSKRKKKIQGFKDKWKGRMETYSLFSHIYENAFEIRPKFATKMTACRFLMNRFSGKMTPVYIGNDETDENVFSVLPINGIGIRVGFSRTKSSKSEAKYRLENPESVVKLLDLFSKRK